MGKKILFASVVVFVTWSALDFVIHGLILGPTYASMPSFWRPQGEMKHGVMYLAVFLAAVAFSAVYGWLVGEKNLATGLKYGLLYGLGTGIGMGYGSYAVMPIPYHMALVWFLGTVVEAAIGGLIAAAIIRR